MTTLFEERDGAGNRAKLKIAIEGCGHGTLDSIYRSVEVSSNQKGWSLSEIDFLIICGDFQAVRNSLDLNCMAVPVKYRELGDFHAYYSGAKKAPVLTFVIGGNHEASNYFFELYHGGWLAENIYYMGAANVVRYGPIRIAAMSGIWKAYDFGKTHHERLPYNENDIRSIFHVREFDVRKLLQIRTQVDIGISHDWPRGIELKGNSEWLFRKKSYFRADSQAGQLGSIAADRVLNRLRPAYWFSGHLHVKYSATVKYGGSLPTAIEKRETTPYVEQPKKIPTPHYDVPKVENKDEIDILMSSDSEKQAKPSPWKPLENKDEIDVLMSSGSDKPAAPSPPKAAEKKSNLSVPADRKIKLNAWASFHQKARKEEGEEAALARAEREGRLAEERRTGIRNVKKFNIEETWRRVEVGEGTSREIVEAKRRKMGNQVDGPSDEYDFQESNPERVNADLRNSSSDDPAEAHDQSDQDATTPKTGDEIKVDRKESSRNKAFEAPKVSNDCEAQPTNVNEIEVKVGGSSDGDIPSVQKNDKDVLARLRAMLPDSFSEAASPPEPSNLPPPADIKNSETRFLALDKVGPKRDFLQLMEVEPVSDVKQVNTYVNSAPRSADGKYRLQYDPEWLAICRTFAGMLEVGDPSLPTPQNMGEAFYAGSIKQHLDWVKEHIIDQDCLDIPRNFSIVAPVYDSNEVVSSSQPREYPNPQTAEFCEMLRIPNKLAITEAEAQARMEAGPRQGSQHNNERRFGGHGGHGRGGFPGGYGGRDGGRDGGRGGQRGGRGGGFRGGRARGRGSRFAARSFHETSSEVNCDHGIRSGASSRGRGGERRQSISSNSKPTTTTQSSCHDEEPGAMLPVSSCQKPTVRGQSSSHDGIPWSSLPDPAYQKSRELIGFD